MRRAFGLVLALLALGVLLPASAGAVERPRFGDPPASFTGDASQWLAQRTIEREWGPSEDSTYHVVEVPGWKSEGWALGLSGAVPGAGHLYLGETSGWVFLLGEAAGWFGFWYERHDAQRQWDKLARFAGDPNDPNSVFSFARYAAETGNDPAALRTLWNGDRNAYYRAIHDDPTWLAGYGTSNPQGAMASYSNILAAHDESRGRERLVQTLLFFNHVYAAVDAWRAARAHNAPLRQEYHLELGEQRVRGGDTQWRAALVRRF